MFSKRLKNQVEGLQNLVALRDASIKKLTTELNVAKRVETKLEEQLIHERKRGPAVGVGDVAFKTGSLLSGSDILVGSNGVQFWEIGPIVATNAEWTYLVKR